VESKFSYTLAGAFVLLLGAALIGVVFWLYAGGQYEHAYRKYYAYFDESVAGLNVNAPVKYRGVEVGRVLALELAPDGSGRVRLLLNLEESAPVREDTVATLRMQGLTGLAQVELSGGSATSRPLKAIPPNEYPVIPTTPSLMTRLDAAITTTLANLNKTSENITALTDEETRRSIKRTLANVEAATRALAEQAPAMGAMFKSTTRTMESAAATSAQLNKLIAHLDQTSTAIDKLAVDISKTNGVARETLEDARNGVDQFGTQTLPEINALVGEMRDLAGSLKRVSRELEQNPNALVFGRKAARPGPGEH
jgi:phospholipid/cholesterol/gamma-HCH transport system substrate-binding protein